MSQPSEEIRKHLVLFGLIEQLKQWFVDNSTHVLNGELLPIIHMFSAVGEQGIIATSENDTYKIETTLNGTNIRIIVYPVNVNDLLRSLSDVSQRIHTNMNNIDDRDHLLQPIINAYDRISPQCELYVKISNNDTYTSIGVASIVNFPSLISREFPLF